MGRRAREDDVTADVIVRVARETGRLRAPHAITAPVTVIATFSQEEIDMRRMILHA